MIGAIMIVVLLLVIFPVSIIMSGPALAAILGTMTKNSVDAAHADTEDLMISEANPYAGPEDTAS